MNGSPARMHNNLTRERFTFWRRAHARLWYISPMHFDALCLACMVDELNATLCPGRVQQVVQTGARSLGLEIYGHGARHTLLLDVTADFPMGYVAAGKARRGGPTDTPLLLLLRKYVRDAGRVAVRQQIAYERLLELEFTNKEHGTTVLVAEFIGRAANIILRRANGMILDCLLRVPANVAGARAVMPGRPYTPPPAQGKISPLDDGTPDYYERLAAVPAFEGPLWKALVAHIAGVSPAQARAMAQRATGPAEAPAHAALLPALVDALQSLWLPTRTGAWSPGCLVQADGRVTAYAPYAMYAQPDTGARWQPQPTLSAAIAATVATRAVPLMDAAEQRDAPAAPARPRDDYAVARAAVAANVRTARARVQRQLAALAGDDPAPGAAAALRTQATWLLALQNRIAPDQAVLEVSAEETGAEPVVVPLDAARTPVQQAEALFKRAGKLERAALFIPARRAHLQNDLDYIDQLEADLTQAQSQPEIAAVRQALHAAGLLPTAKATAERAAPPAGPRRYTLEGCTIWVGRNAQQNDKLTFTTAKPDDYWLHVRGAPGSHVLVHCVQGEPSAAVLETAARLAAHFSTHSGERAADVIVTQRRHLARPPDGRPGQVHVRQESVLRVAATLPEGLHEQMG